jgi:transglutaminase-like putative cysteine protease
MPRSRALLLGVVAAAVIAWNWLRLEEPAGAGRATLLILLALVPALARDRRLRWTLAAAALLVAGGIAFRLGPSLHFPGRVLGRFWDGFLEFYDVQLPFTTALHPHMDAGVLLGVFLFTLATVLAVCARRTALAMTILLVGAGWPATLLAGSELLRGAAILGAMLVLLAGMRERAGEPGRAVLVGGAIVLAGVAASSSPAFSKTELLRWQTWDLHTPGSKPVSVSYVWNSNYSGLTFPHKRTVVLKIQAPRRPQYWQVVALNTVVSGRWFVDPALQVQSSGDLGEPGLVPYSALRRFPLAEQHVTVEGLNDTYLPAATVPVQFDASSLGLIEYDPSGMAVVPRGLKRGDSYRAFSFEPNPTPKELAASKPDYPQLISVQKKYLYVDTSAWVPPFGSPGRDAVIKSEFADRYGLAAYRPLYRVARQVAGGAKSPYAAAVALESWFRVGGGFTYDQHPSVSHGRPELVDFVTRTRAGYCQHFAGAMALMLRYLGIPSRVAAGFSTGTYDSQSGEWTVTDHDAHEWVEVWFRGWGWVPFDPTPSRGGLAGKYSASSSVFDAAAAALVLAGKDGLKAFADKRTLLGFPGGPSPHISPDVPDLSHHTPLSIPADQHHSRAPGLLRLLALLLAGAFVAVATVKFAVRRSRYLTRDPRRLAAACRHELRDILVDQLVEVPPSATLAELVELAQTELGVEAHGLGLHGTVARFAPPAYALEAARELRGSLRALRRNVRRELPRWERARGLLSLRSLGLS